MRKIFIYRERDPKSFDLRCGIFQKTDDGGLELLKEYEDDDRPLARYPKDYNRHDVEKLMMVDALLAERGEEPLTKEEMAYIVEPVTLLAPATSKATPEEMARLAGFRVTETGEKVIEYFDDNKKSKDE